MATLLLADSLLLCLCIIFLHKQYPTMPRITKIANLIPIVMVCWEDYKKIITENIYICSNYYLLYIKFTQLYSTLITVP